MPAACLQHSHKLHLSLLHLHKSEAVPLQPQVPIFPISRIICSCQSINSFYQVLSAEAYSKHGFNIHGVVFDELHTQPNRKLFDVMTKGSGDARTQPLYFLITTAGTDTNSICYETHQKAKDIIEGRKIDPTFYPDKNCWLTGIQSFSGKRESSLSYSAPDTSLPCPPQPQIQ